LFSEPVNVQLEYYRQTRIFPIIHLIVVREEIAQDRQAYDELAEAFRVSKEAGLAGMIESATDSPVVGASPEQIRATFGIDPYPYGVEENRHVLELLLQDAFNHQHLTERQLTVDELFPGSALER
jgi:4,5-dihydroxyphthalate decarboxylase